MKEVGASCEVIPVEGGDHGLATWEFDPEMQTYKKRMIVWLKRILATKYPNLDGDWGILRFAFPKPSTGD
ncbi:MAG: hypothetical protein M3Y07_02645 [Acidobacteriota bacterium]|nr:hypothetical protein [Acidobacteriota bacterium]